MIFLASSSIINHHNPIKCKYYQQQDHNKQSHRVYGCFLPLWLLFSSYEGNSFYMAISAIFLHHWTNTHIFLQYTSLRIKLLLSIPQRLSLYPIPTPIQTHSDVKIVHAPLPSSVPTQNFLRASHNALLSFQAICAIWWRFVIPLPKSKVSFSINKTVTPNSTNLLK